MSTRIRLRRMGSKGRPFYRVVVADQRSPRDGRFIENIGRYQPLNDPSLIEIDPERALHWLRVGAQPSNQVRNLMQKIGIWDTFVAERPKAAASSGAPKPERPAKEKLSKKAQAKAAEAAKTAAEPAPEAAKAAAEPAPEEAAPEAVEPASETITEEAPTPEPAEEEAPTPEPAEAVDETATEAAEEPTEA
jgi:small subunit ribosomal protein S16